jgi:exonuclease SbcC
LSERTVELNRALAEHAFDSVQEVRAGTLSTAEREQLSEQVRRYRERVAAVSAQLESAELGELPETLSVDVDALKKAHTDAQVKARQAGHLAKAASKTLKDGEYRSTEVKRAMERLHEVDAEARPTIRMAEIAAGTSSDNISRTTLATYVLKRRFEDVVEAANTRLRQLSEGRYELARSDEREDVASRRTGLALRVIDHETEKERDPRTLSGGETFNASLSLALGLADVVTGEAGGVELGTLFIDEGFGTLDPEALDRVVAVLGNLRDGGRTVGVVSHVETLKQAISDGITVTRLLSGASTLTVRA